MIKSKQINKPGVTCAAFLSGGVDMALLALMESMRAPSCFRVEHSDPVSCRQRKD